MTFSSIFSAFNGSFAVLSALGILLTQCSVSPLGPIGNEISAPFSIVTLPNSTRSVILNSGTYSRFTQGSLMPLDISGDGQKVSQGKAVPVPLLGTEMAVTKDGSLIAAGFSTDVPQIRFYNSQNPDALVELESSRFIPDTLGVVSKMSFFTHAATGKLYLSVVLIPKDKSLGTAKVYVLNIGPGGTSSEVILRIPDDFPSSDLVSEGGGKKGYYQLGFAAPFYIESLGLFGVFPQFGVPSAGLREKPYDFFKSRLEAKGPGGTTANPETLPGETRRISMVLFDLNQAASASVPWMQTAAFFPLGYNGDATKIDLTSPFDSPGNKSFDYQSGFVTAQPLDETGCLSKTLSSGETGKLFGFKQTFSRDSVVVEDLTEGELLSFSGFDVMQAWMNTRPLTTDFRQRISFEGWNVRLFSRTHNVDGLNKTITSVPNVHLVDGGPGAACVPAWLRVFEDRRTVTLGNEQAKLQWPDPASPPERPLGQTTEFFTTRGVSSSALQNGLILVPSFAYGKILTARYEPSTGKFVQVIK